MRTIVSQFTDYFKVVFKKFCVTYAVVIGNLDFQMLLFDGFVEVYNAPESHIFYCFPCRGVCVAPMCAVVLLDYRVQFETGGINRAVESLGKLFFHYRGIDKPLRIAYIVIGKCVGQKVAKVYLYTVYVKGKYAA